ncbi:MAG: ABC transporter permease [Candidatus Omnitrophica bacterium]|nr:ABC transporter permease [Candidatus Omnitrophota bacterium]
MLKRVLAFFKKDFLIESSYKLSFLLNIFAVLASILTYFFIDKLFGNRMVENLNEFGVNYFSYVLLSMAFFSYVGVGLGSFSNRIRAEQMQGTLEALLLTPTRTSTILLSLALWNLCVATFNMAIYILLGIYLFKINFTNINWLSTMVILLLTITSFSGLGIFSASFIMVFKRGNPAGWFIATLEGLIGGVYFPITVMPCWLQLLAKFLPITYAIRAIELAVYRGFGVIQLSKEIAILLLFSCLLLPLSFASFKYALKKARRQGSLLQY